jgi:adenylate cyclase
VKLVPALCLTIAGIGFVAWLGFERGLWLLVAAPATGCLISAALVTSLTVLLERADRNAVQMIFSKHVSKKVAATVLAHRETFMAGGMMPARAIRATVVFTDLAGFSTASEKLTAEQTLRWLNEYMTAMVEIVEAHDGEVNKFIGDAIMALFGAPIAREDDAGLAEDAARAVRCALKMREEVPRLNARWRETEPDMPSVAMRVGIFTGMLVHGSFGAADRTEYTVIGDTVNRSNRLEAAGKEIKDQLTEEEKICSILIGPETFQRVGHLFETVPVPDLVLKGIAERVTVYRVLAERVSSKPSQIQRK